MVELTKTTRTGPVSEELPVSPVTLPNALGRTRGEVDWKSVNSFFVLFYYLNCDLKKVFSE